LNIPAKISETGKRQQFFYRTQKLALAAADDLKRKVELFGAQTRAIGPTLAEEATTASNLLKPLGFGLLEAVRRFVENETRNRASVTVETALEAFRDANESGEVQARAYRLLGEKLIAEFSDRMLSSVTGEELQKHLEATTGGPGAFNQNLRLVRAIWRWCAKPPRKWCAMEAVEYLEGKSGVSSEIGVLTHGQALKLMATAEKHYPEAVPAFAIALFTGMRQQEIDRLTAGDITAEGITVPATSAKTKRRRYIQMPAPLAAWLAEYPIGGTVTPPDWMRKQQAVRRLAGWRVWCSLIDPPAPPAELPDWPANALRHTAASVALALGKPLETLIFEHGHTGGVEMLRRHYIGAMPKAEALKIWSIGPNGRKLPALAIA
jgi:integrase